MVNITCWIVILLSPFERDVLLVKGHVMREGGDNVVVNFYEDFKAKGVDLNINSVEQLVNENSCLYE